MTMMIEEVRNWGFCLYHDLILKRKEDEAAQGAEYEDEDEDYAIVEVETKNGQDEDNDDYEEARRLASWNSIY